MGAMKGRGYTAMRRKPWYPRNKRPRWRAKLGAAQWMILRWLWHWDETRQMSVEPLYAKDLKAHIQRLTTIGIVWKPNRMAMYPGSREERHLSASQRAAISRALHGLASRGMVELIPFPGSSRTHMVKLTRRGVAESKRRLIPPSKLLTY
jgi:hypothetical protein